MVIAFIFWTIISLLFVVVGYTTGKASKSTGFFTWIQPVKMKDVKGYNRAVAKIWYGFAAGLEILGIPLLFAEQNSAIYLLVVVGTVVLILAVMIAYFKVEAKYRE